MTSNWIILQQKLQKHGNNIKTNGNNTDSIKSFDPSKFQIQSFHSHIDSILVLRWVKVVHSHTHIHTKNMGTQFRNNHVIEVGNKKNAWESLANDNKDPKITQKSYIQWRFQSFIFSFLYSQIFFSPHFFYRCKLWEEK